ncbi:thiol reductant ABC exporter subunit CydC [Galactobacter caseinivorans]|uniref:Thiol reductant ABC exporter subunit CydC n=1 Tax=Galactobacter caseinivorans TaxID=2676123 RepID=A0A496PMD8_9MICC|nr:thiol reductant ABC exporter subunit CydC [Galactobacter caseinivorans]RKW71703.1 thiol reductant ABC exporter subunit CydC [Galactobacter caseinivorans]
MKPEIPEGTTTRGWLLGLGALAAAKAAGLIALMSAIAAALAQAAAGSAVDVGALLLWGITGAVVRAGATWATRVVAQRAALGVKEELRSQLVRHRVESGSTRREAEVSALASRGLDGLDPYFRDYLPALVSCAVIPLAVGARILFADWVSALILVLTIPLVPVFMILIGLHTAERVGQAQAGLDRLGRHLTELARGLPVLVGLRRADQQRRALAQVSERHRVATMGTLRTAFLSAFALELIATLSVAVVAVFIGVRLVHGSMTLEAGLLALLLAPDAFTPLRDLGSAHHASEDGVAALRRVRDELDAPIQPEHGLHAGDSGDTDATGPVISDLVVERAGRESVGPVSFAAAPGMITALLGPSGCGKSTVLDVLAGTLRATDNSAADPATDSAAATEPVQLRGRVNGVDPRRRAMVAQAPRFAAATARAEVALYAGEDRTRELEALLPEPLWDTPLERLSPGERRRVGVARGVARAHALLRDGHGSLLLLDEPTAHLDPDSAGRVRALIANCAAQGVTVVLATHDVELAALARLRVEWELTSSPVVSTISAGSPAVYPPALPSGAPAQARAVGQESAAAAEPLATPGTARGAWRLLPLRSWRLWAAVGLGALSVLAAAALSGLSGWLIVQASQQPPMLHLMVAIVGVRACGLARAVLRYRERLATHDVVLRWAAGLRVRLWDSLGSDARGWNRLTRPGGALATLIAEVDELRDALPRVLVPIPAAILAAIASAVTIALVAPAALPVAVMVLALGVVAVPLLVLAVERRAARHLADHRADVAERTGRVLAAAPDLSANNLSDAVSRDFARDDARGTADLRRDALGAGAGRAAASLLSGVGAVAAILAGAAATDPRLLALAVLLLLAMDEPLGQLGDALRNVPVLGTMLARVGPWVSDDARRARLPAASASPAEVGAEPGTRPSTQPGRVDGVRVSGLSAGYGEKPIFSDVSGEAVPGRVWAVTGPSGSGKSTLIATILGFLPARQGSVELREAKGGAEAAERWLPAAQAGVAWCPQDGYVFDSTLRGNLALARDREHAPSEQEMETALHRVGLGRWYADLPRGLDTLTGAGGERLSGGQRQRLAVARTLLSGAGVVVLDEPTAHLGQDEGHELVRDVTRGAGPTALVLVTHDAAVAATADRLTVLPGRH